MKQHISGIVRRSVLASCVSAAAVLGFSETASASLTVCNYSGEPVTFVNTYWDTNCTNQTCNGWRKDGWYNIANNTCQNVFSGSANNRYFYWYAQAYDTSPKWTSDTFRWQHTSAGHFQCTGDPIGNYDYCANGTYFFNAATPYYNHRELHTTATNWTLNLTP